MANLPEPIKSKSEYTEGEKKAVSDARNKRIFNLWLACHTQEEIAGRENVTKETVSQICQKMAELPESDKPAANHLTDFDVPLYNVWKQQEKSEGSKHYGMGR